MPGSGSSAFAAASVWVAEVDDCGGPDDVCGVAEVWGACEVAEPVGVRAAV